MNSQSIATEMIKHDMFSIHDSKAQTYDRPFTSVNAAVALRDFTTAVIDPDSNLNKHATDYSLWHVGQWNLTTGTPEPAESKTCIAHAHEVIQRYETNQAQMLNSIQGGK